MSKRAAPKGKKINPHFFVFCEGETEEAYVGFLRTYYRVPIEIVSKIVGNRITEKYIKNYKKSVETDPKDKDFLMYDADVPETLEKLKNIKSALLIASNPCIELWFLLHYKKQSGIISGKECARELSNMNKNTYVKGIIGKVLQSKLIENKTTACNRAKELEVYNNPSSNMYKFIEILDEIKSLK